MANETERAEFEKWAVGHFVRLPAGLNPVEKDGSGHYVHANVSQCWLAVQAASSARQGTLELALEHAARDLPEFCRIELTVERGSAWVSLFFYESGEEDGPDNHDNSLAEQIEELLAKAMR